MNPNETDDAQQSSPDRGSGRGRPPKPEQEVRKNHTVRLSEKEKRAAEKKAERAGLKLGTYLRRAAVGAQMATAEKRADRAETIRQLARIGNNLNQIAHQLNRGDEVERRRLAEALDQFECAVSRI